MSTKLFTNKELEILSKNKYVKNITMKGITYTDEFKSIFIAENEKGKFPREIFEECGFDIDVLGIKRIKSVIEKYKLKNMVSHLCQIAEVSRSGYYNYFSSKSQNHRSLRNEKI